jgi:propionyl-CoA carboxylase alpha chain
METPVTLSAEEGGYGMDVDGIAVHVRSGWAIGQPLFEAIVTSGELAQALVVQIDRKGIGYRLFHGGRQVDAMVLTPGAAKLTALMPKKAAPDMSKFLLSPMPGLLVSLAIEEGQEIKAGEVLAVVEAMKMENILRAERDGMIGKLHAKPGDSLAVDQKIVEFA